MKKDNQIKKLIVFSLLTISLSCFSFASTSELDSLEQVLNKHLAEGKLSDQITAYQNIAKFYSEEKDNYELALTNAEKALKLSEEIGEIKQLASSLKEVGHLHDKFNQYDEALKYYFRIRDMSQEGVNKEQQTANLSSIARIYQVLGDYSQAYDFQIQALEIGEASNDSAGVNVCLYRLGSIFYYQENYDLALEHYEKALIASQQLNNVRMEYSSSCAIGAAYQNLGEMEKSLKYLKVALQLAKDIEDDSAVAYALINIGVTYSSMKFYKEAEEHINEAYLISQKRGDRWGEVGALSNLGKVLTDTGDYSRALKYLNKGLKIAETIGSKARMEQLYGLLSEVHSKMNNHKLAFDFLKQETILKDSILGEKTVKEMGTRKTRYEVHKRESEITLLKKEKQIANLNGYMLIGTAVFLLLLSGLLFSRIQVQKKSNQLLEEKNKKIFLQKEKLEAANERQKETNKLLEQKNEQIHVQNKKLEDSNDDLKQFAYVASHDLKEPLRMISSYTTLLDKRYNHLFDETASEFFLYITDGVYRMETMLTDLLSYSRVNSQQKPAQPVKTGDIMEIVAATLRAKVEEAGGEIRFEPARLPIILSNRTNMTQLFQNLVSNALKFMGDKKPCVEVDCIQQDNFYRFSVKDNGIGISPDNIDKIFEMFRRLHTRDEYEGTGIGLATVKKIIERHGGKIWVESEVNVGSTFYFTIPVPEAVGQSDQKAVKEPEMA